MTTICWTIIHRAASPVVKTAARLGHVTGRFIHPVAYRAARAAHHVATAAGPSRTWVEVVCRVIPAAVVGGGLLAPHPVNPPRLPPAPAPITQPAQAAPPWLFPPGLDTVPVTPVVPYPSPFPVEPTGALPVGPPSVGPTTPVENVPEPSSAGLLLAGVAGLLLIRAVGRTARP
jgi:hypothetical protein